MQAYRIIIEPVSPGTRGGGNEDAFKTGTGRYATLPPGQRSTTVDLTAVQVVGVQGYINCVKGGLDTSSIEAAITAVGPT